MKRKEIKIESCKECLEHYSIAEKYEKELKCLTKEV